MDIFKTLILDTPDTLSNISGILPVSNGGTGADNAPDARTNLGLGNVDNTSDANKPVSTAQQTALDLKADLISPTLVTPALGTPSSGVVTNLTGTASIDINGTVGAATPSTGAFTTVDATSTITSTGVASMFRAKRTGQNADFRIYQGVNNTVLDNANGDQINFAIGGTSAAILTATGLNSAAIGATTPSTGAFTSVSATSTANNAGQVALLLQNADGNAGIGSRLGWRLDNLANEWGYINVNRVGGGATAQMDFAVNNAAYSGAPSVAMTVLGSGNVGVGLTAPVNKLEVVGTSAAPATSGAAANGATRLYGSGSGLVLDSGIDGSGSNAWLQARLYNNYASNFNLALNPNGGNVGVGTSAPTDKLTVNGGLSVVQTSSVNNININDGSGNLGATVTFLGAAAATGKSWQVGNQIQNTDTLTFTPSTANGGSTFTTPTLTLTGASNVGVGTVAPATKLHVQTATNGGIVVNDGTVNGIIYGSTTLTNSFAIGTTSNHPLIFGTNNTFPQMTLATSGNVGIGTTSPARKLTVNSGSSNTAASFISTDNYALIKFEDSATTTETSLGAYANDLVFRVGDAEKLRINSSGNVGVGTSAPTAKFVVSGGGAAIQGNGYPTTGAGWEFYTDTTTGSWAQSYSRTGGVWLDANWNALTHKLSTSGTERMRITSAGDVIIGGTALPSGTTQAAAWDNASKYVRVGTSVSTAATLMAFYNSNGAVGTITTSGTATAYNTSSDYRLKENVVPMQDALQRITQLKPSRFNFIADDSVVVDGFLAHEVQEVVPEAISGEKDAMRDEEYEVTPAVLDDDGNETTPAVMDTRSVPDYQGIDQSKLVPLLVGAIQELNARIESLENN